MIRVLSALLLGVLLISSCSESSENGERLMPREVEVNWENLNWENLTWENLSITAHEARRMPGMVEVELTGERPAEIRFSQWFPSGHRFTPGEVGYLVLRFQNHLTPLRFVSRIDVFYRRSDVHFVDQLMIPDTVIGEGQWWDAWKTFYLDGNDEFVIPFVVMASTVFSYHPAGESGLGHGQFDVPIEVR